MIIAMDASHRGNSKAVLGQVLSTYPIYIKIDR